MFTSSSNMNTNFNMPWTSVNKNCKWQRKMNSYRTVWYTTHTALLSNTSKFSWKKKRWKKGTVSLKISPCTQVTLAHGDTWSRWENGCSRKSRSHRSETTTRPQRTLLGQNGIEVDFTTKFASKFCAVLNELFYTGYHLKAGWSTMGCEMLLCRGNLPRWSRAQSRTAKREVMALQPRLSLCSVHRQGPRSVIHHSLKSHLSELCL